MNETVTPGADQTVEMSDEDIFEEEYNRRLGITAPPAAGVNPDDGGEGDDDGEGGGDEGDAGGESAAPTPPPSQPVATPPAAAQPVGKKPAAEPLPAWFEKLPEEAKTAFNEQQQSLSQLRQQYTAVHGRLAPVQQENERLRARLTDSGRRAPPPQAAAPAGTPTLNLKDIAEFTEFQKEYPDEARAIEAVFGRQAQHIAHLNEQLGTVVQGLQRIETTSSSRKREADLAKLSEAHSDWMQVRPSEDFLAWLQVQPRAVAMLADSSDADDCIYILDRYKQDVYLQRQQSQPAPPSTPSTAHGVRQRRAQIRSVPGLDPQASDVGMPQGNPDANLSDEEIWSQEVERRLRAQRDNRR